ncbi:hypothetical protein ONR57_16770 [Hoyosella sp. YIM 151337]|uniref:hypothetical protein n=1 Tax=Hoyosella sp. YIM 151337 TaxID=2992742 RepID=UPI002235E8DB|nr:hypothetical protein [Hoyosella sp. YIM 151337]MCW4354959.1 hypothetical protein [Hoyosella sp. YIM 151337]
MNSDIVFIEPGAQWRALLFVPIFCLAGIVAEIWMGGPVHWLGWAIAATLLTSVVAWQVYAARAHLRVELTIGHLRQGAETLALDDVEDVLPSADDDPKLAAQWQSARALGELHGVPRRRTGIGLRLRSGTVVQAWARDHATLRAALQQVLAVP